MEEHTERVQIGVRADGASHRLLGRHVGGRTDRRAGVGEAGGVAVQDGGDAQVEDGDRAVRTHHQIAGFEVAVDDRHGVHGGERGAELGGDGDGPLPGVRIVLGEMVGEVGALDVLHDEEQVVAVAARVMDGDQARVVDLGGDPALTDEAATQLVDRFAAGGTRDPVGPEQFHRDPAVEALVVRRPDLAHAALAEDGRQLVPSGDDASAHRSSS